MKLNSIVKATTRFVANGKRVAAAKSPTILVIFGGFGVIASTVMACRETLKLNDILEESKANIEAVHAASEDPALTDSYSEADAGHDLSLIYIQTGVKIIKLYAPSIVLGTLSLASIMTSHRILTRRNAALGAAYAALDQSFKGYRDRVVERFGKRVDHELKHNIKAVEVEETVVDEKTGKEKKVKKTVDVANGDPNDPYSHSPYAKFFDEASRYWVKDAESNLTFLMQRQAEFNDLLKIRYFENGKIGHVFLNEVYEALDIPKTQAGQFVGWVYDPNDPNHKGDNVIDFGLSNVSRPKTRAFVNGYERCVLLDFNVDGRIVDRLSKW